MVLQVTLPGEPTGRPALPNPTTAPRENPTTTPGGSPTQSTGPGTESRTAGQGSEESQSRSDGPAEGPDFSGFDPGDGPGAPGAGAREYTADELMLGKVLQQVGAIFQGVGNIVCKRCGVSPITDEEAGSLALATVNVAGEYSVTLDPRSAAWIGLATVGVGVVGSRFIEARLNAARDVTPKDEAEAA